MKLTNTHKKLTEDKKLTLGFIGGSITQGDSARVIIQDGNIVSRNGDILLSYVNRIATWFKDAYPQADIETVNAGISDTATNFGIYRLEKTLMNRNGHNMPDLVFVEFTTNDFLYDSQKQPEIEIQAESIFRNIWAYNPYAEIVVISTNVAVKSQSIDAYRTVCDYYDIPFINVGKTLREAKLSRGYEQESKGTLYYTIDNIHPSQVGYAVYSDEILPILKENLVDGLAPYNYKENLPVQRSNDLIDNPNIITADKLTLAGEVKVKNGSLYADIYGTKLEIQKIVFEEKYVDITGQSEMKTTFYGSALGVLVYLSGVGFELDWQVDDGAWRHFEVNKNNFSFELYQHPQVFMLEHHLEKKEHFVKLKFSKNSIVKLGGMIINAK